MTPAKETERIQTVGALTRHFLGWQCRLRQHAVRHDLGRPGPGMRPRAVAIDGTEIAPALTVLIVPRDPAESTALFRHQCKKTLDPKQRYERALELLSAAYFQHPEDFSDVLTALFAPGAPVAATLRAAGRSILEFAQFSQAYRLPCRVEALTPADPFYQATFWHNHLFNPNLPGDADILAFRPDWTGAVADPSP